MYVSCLSFVSLRWTVHSEVLPRQKKARRADEEIKDFQNKLLKFSKDYPKGRSSVAKTTGKDEKISDKFKTETPLPLSLTEGNKKRNTHIRALKGKTKIFKNRSRWKILWEVWMNFIWILLFFSSNRFQRKDCSDFQEDHFDDRCLENKLQNEACHWLDA